MFAAATAGVDRSAGAEERHRRRQDALRVWQPGAGACVTAARGTDAGRLKHDAQSAAHQPAHAPRPATPRPSLRAHAGDTAHRQLLVIVAVAVAVDLCDALCLQCFDAVGWAAGRTSGL